MNPSENSQFLGTEKIGKLMLKFSVPCVLSLLVSALYNIVDQIFIGNSELSALGNAATGIVFPIFIIAQAFAWCFGDGCAAYLNISLICNIMLAKYGAMSHYGIDIPIAVIGIESKVFTVVINFVVGIVLGCQPIISYTMGAKKNIRRSDEARAAYYKNISGQSWGDQHNYDLLIDSSIGIESSAEVICRYVMGTNNKK